MNQSNTVGTLQQSKLPKLDSYISSKINKNQYKPESIIQSPLKINQPQQQQQQQQQQQVEQEKKKEQVIINIEEELESGEIPVIDIEDQIILLPTNTGFLSDVGLFCRFQLELHNMMKEQVQQLLNEQKYPYNNNRDQQQQQYKGIKRPYEIRIGDWICPREQCRNVNFGKRMQCNRCGESRPDEIYDLSQVVQPAVCKDPETKPKKDTGYLGGPPGLFKEGDWQCKFCGNINFEKRQQCNRCKKNKEEIAVIDPEVEKRRLIAAEANKNINQKSQEINVNQNQNENQENSPVKKNLFETSFKKDVYVEKNVTDNQNSKINNLQREDDQEFFEEVKNEFQQQNKRNFQGKFQNNKKNQFYKNYQENNDNNQQPDNTYNNNNNNQYYNNNNNYNYNNNFQRNKQYNNNNNNNNNRNNQRNQRNYQNQNQNYQQRNNNNNNRGRQFPLWKSERYTDQYEEFDPQNEILKENDTQNRINSVKPTPNQNIISNSHSIKPTPINNPERSRSREKDKKSITPTQIQ